MPRRSDTPEPEPDRAPDDRTWSARSNLHERDVGQDVVRFTPLPAETGPVWAPDQLSIWPVEGGRFGIDAHPHARRAPSAPHTRSSARRRGAAGDGAAGAVRRRDPALGTARPRGGVAALEAFLGRPLDVGV